MCKYDDSCEGGKLTNKLIRPLGGMERAFHSYSLAYPVLFSVVVELSGVVDSLSFRPALLSLQAIHPFLRVHVENMEGAGLSFIECNDEIACRIVPAEDRLDWRALVQQELAFREYSGHALASASLIHSAESSTIVLTFAHVIADGRSGVSIALDLVAIINGETPVARQGLPGMDVIVVGDAGRTRFAPPSADVPAAAHPVSFRSDNAAQLTVKTRFLAEAETAALATRCRENGVTIHGALLAAAALVSMKGPTDTVRISSPVDLRPGFDMMTFTPGLFIALVATEVRRGESEGFWTLAARSKEGIELSRSPESIGMLVSALSAGIPAQPDPPLACAVLGPLVGDLMISNLGVIPEASSSHALKIKAMWAPALNTQVLGNEMIGIATYGETLRMVHISEKIDSLLLDELLAVLIKIIYPHLALG